jgi:hypothetical protein
MESQMKHAQRWTEWLDHGFGIEVCLHSVLNPEEREASQYSPPRCWNTYLYFCDRVRISKDGKLCDPYCEADPLVDLFWADESILRGLEGWNGGITFIERLTDHQTGQRRLKVGDDYQHLWDGEWNAWDHYDLRMMERRIRNVAKELMGWPEVRAAIARR